MRGGFLRGLFVGAVVGTVSGMLMDSEYREKAKEMIHTGGELWHKAEGGMEMAGNLVNKGRQMLENQVEPAMEQMSGAVTKGMSEMSGYGGMGNLDGGSGDGEYGQGKENIDSRVAILERRLEELESHGV